MPLMSRMNRSFSARSKIPTGSSFMASKPCSMNRCILKSLAGDAINAILARAGSNIRKLLRLLSPAQNRWLSRILRNLQAQHRHRHLLNTAATATIKFDRLSLASEMIGCSCSRRWLPARNRVQVNAAVFWIGLQAILKECTDFAR